MRIENNLNSSLINYNKITNKIQSSQNFQVQENNEVISKLEKQFFAELFPNNKNEVMSYSFYNRSGKVNTAQIGTLFDRRY
jgi:hypothetical protein